MINLNDLGEFDSLEDLNKELQERMNIHNRSALDDFDGLPLNKCVCYSRIFPYRMVCW